MELGIHVFHVPASVCVRVCVPVHMCMLLYTMNGAYFHTTATTAS